MDGLSRVGERISVAVSGSHTSFGGRCLVFVFWFPEKRGWHRIRFSKAFLLRAVGSHCPRESNLGPCQVHRPEDGGAHRAELGLAEAGEPNSESLG